MKNKTIIASAGFIATALLVVSIPAASSESSEQFDSSIAVLDAQQRPQDLLPEEAMEILTLTGVDEASVRSLGETNEAHFWAGANSQGDVCLISRVKDVADGYPEDAKLFGANCTPADVAARDGVALRIQGAEGTSLAMHMLSGELSPESVRILEDEIRPFGGDVLSREGTAVAVVSGNHVEGALELEVELNGGNPLNLQIIGH